MDKTGADFYMTIESIKTRLCGNKVFALQLPIGAESTFSGIIDLVENKAYKFEGKMGETIVEIPVPADMVEKVATYRAELMEKAAEQDDELMDAFFESGELTIEQIKKGLRKGITANKIYGACCGSALQNVGVQFVIDAACEYLPSPLDVNNGIVTVMDIDDKEVTEEIKVDGASPLGALAFKIATDPFVGKICFIRVYTGTLRAGSYVYNPSTGQKERIGRLLQMHANTREEIEEIPAGHIGAAVGLKDTRTGDTLCDVNKVFKVESMEFPEPVISVSVEPKSKADQERMGMALSKLAEEDPSFRVRVDEETGQTIISGMGELHLDIIVDRMRREFKVECNVGAPQVAYRETIKAMAKDVEHKYSKQT